MIFNQYRDFTRASELLDRDRNSLVVERGHKTRKFVRSRPEQQEFLLFFFYLFFVFFLSLAESHLHSDRSNASREMHDGGA